ncbi:MAG: hypothetical protein ABFC57_18105 [Veillonellales bacterium]
MGDLVFRNPRILSFSLLTVTAAFLLTGCFFKPAQDTKSPAAPQIGVIDMNKAIKAHPKYPQLAALQQQYNLLAAKLESRQSSAAMNASNNAGAGEQPLIPLPEEPRENSGAAFEQEYNARMAAKQAELKDAVDSKTARTRQELAAERQAYNEELDQQYQTPIFSLQLKLKTLQLEKGEMAALAEQLEQLQQERSVKAAAREQSLAARLDSVTLAAKSEAEEQLAAFSRQLQEEIDQKAAAKAAEISSRNQTLLPENPPPDTTASPRLPDTGEDEKMLALKRQEIDSLQQAIIEDIRDKAAQVAAGRGMETVLANVRVNLSAEDITMSVINEFSTFSSRLQ